MFTLTNKAAVLLAVCCLPIAPLLANGQQTKGETITQQTQSQSNGTTDAKTTDKTKENKPLTKNEILVQEQQELDALLTGAWVFLARDNEPNISTQKARIAAARCGAGRTTDQSVIQSGDVVFVRSQRGLQRLDVKTGKIIVFSAHEKKTDPRRGVIWGLRSGRLVHQVSIRDAQTRAGLMKVMLENRNVYLRCQAPPSSN